MLIRIPTLFCFWFLTAATVTCLAEITVGNGAIVLDSSVTAAYDSNIRAAADDTADSFLIFYPELRYRRMGSRFKTDVSAGVRFKRYLDHTAFNSDDASARFNWGMQRSEGETTGAALQIGYVETSDAVLEVNDQVRARNFFASTSGEVLMAGRNLLSAGLAYRDHRYDIGSDQKSASGRLGYSYVGMPDGTIISTVYTREQNKTTASGSGFSSLDQKADTVSLAVSHPFRSELVATVSGGYRWLERGATEAALALPDRNGAVFDFTLKGPFLPRQHFPKTTGTFRLAYEQSAVPGLNDASRNRLVGQLNVAWQARERTTVSVFASRSQDLSIQDLTVVNTSTGMKVTQLIGSFLTANLDLRYTNAKFVNLTREDDRYEAELSGAYQVNRRWSANAAYRYSDSQSTVFIADYKRHFVMLALHYVL